MLKSDYFDLFNPVQSGQKRSRVQHLLDILALREEWAMDAGCRLETLDSPHVAVFFQLPLPILVEDVTYKMPALRGNMQIQLQFKPFLLAVTPGGSVITHTPPVEHRINSTQVIAYVPLWGRWAEAFRRYERCFTNSGFKDDIVLPKERYSGDRTLRARDFEHELSLRIEREVAHALRRFLKSFSTIIREPDGDPVRLYGKFMMPYPGRLSAYGEAIPLVGHFLAEASRKVGTPIAADKISRGVEFTYRKFSRFEIQLFELNRLVRTGNHALALAGALSLIEWLLRLSASKKVKRLRFGELIEHFSTRGLADDLDLVHELRKLRNKATHLGEYSTSETKRPYEILSIDIDETIDQEVTRSAIDLAWRVFQKANSGAL
jgi:hypothetical protein